MKQINRVTIRSNYREYYPVIQPMDSLYNVKDAHLLNNSDFGKYLKENISLISYNHDGSIWWSLVYVSEEFIQNYVDI